MRRYIYGGTIALLLSSACGETVGLGNGHGGSGGVGGDAGEAGADAPGTAAKGGSIASPVGGTGPLTGGTSAGGKEASPGGDDAGGEANPGPDPNAPQERSDKLDLLLALDNSVSMADKQKLLANALPNLIGKLINPACVNSAGQTVAQPDSPEAACPAGSSREIAPLRDVHVGVITSSLGSHGGSAASEDVCTDVAGDDHAHLIPTVRPNVASYDNLGYLKWDPEGLATPVGESDPQAFIEDVQAMVTAAGEHGCGFESQLESAYRFLVDPEPPLAVTVPPGQQVAVVQGVDDVLLGQREAFLRPDSSVVVLMLSDENDCSIQDEGYGWLLARQEKAMFKSTSACAADPNNPCCQSCAETVGNAGCGVPQNDVACQAGTMLDPSEFEDPINLRCWEQKRRFGFELLYPLSRYVEGFGGYKVAKRSSGELVDNPLFHRNGITRSPTLFTFAFLGGVPWQDIATPASLTGGPLEYLSAAELVEKKRWPMIAGEPSRSEPPTDPFMHESTEPRSGKNPVTGDDITPATSLDPQANPINGHEAVNVENQDLQYACTFTLPEPIECTKEKFDGQDGCDCFQEDIDAGFNRPLCQPLGGGPATTTQSYGKAYPSLRQLAVTRDLRSRGVVGSVCAPSVVITNDMVYGYGPLVDALAHRLTATLAKP